MKAQHRKAIFNYLIVKKQLCKPGYMVVSYFSQLWLKMICLPVSEVWKNASYRGGGTYYAAAILQELFNVSTPILQYMKVKLGQLIPD